MLVLPLVLPLVLVPPLVLPLVQAPPLVQVQSLVPYLAAVPAAWRAWRQRMGMHRVPLQLRRQTSLAQLLQLHSR